MSSRSLFAPWECVSPSDMLQKVVTGRLTVDVDAPHVVHATIMRSYAEEECWGTVLRIVGACAVTALNRPDDVLYTLVHAVVRVVGTVVIGNVEVTVGRAWNC